MVEPQCDLGSIFSTSLPHRYPLAHTPRIGVFPLWPPRGYPVVTLAPPRPTGHTPRGRRRLPTLLRARHTQALARTRTCTCTPRPSHLARTYTCTTCLPCHLTCLHVTPTHRALLAPTHRALLTPTHLHTSALAHICTPLHSHTSSTPALTYICATLHSHTSSTCTQPPPACLYPAEAVLRAGARVLGKSLAAVPCSRSRAPIDESRPSEHCISNTA